MKLNIKFIVAILLIAILTACNFPGQTHQVEISASDMVLTAAVQTVEAQIALNPTSTNDPSASATLSFPTPNTNPSNGATPAPSGSTEPDAPRCDVASFVDDVTVPDGTEFSPGDIFTKTWRLKNNGTCSWTTAYEIVFFDGDSLSGSASKQLSNISVFPGETVDISIEMTAPATEGTYRGYWKLRNANGEEFTFANDLAFFVEIDVITPTPTPGPKIETFSLTMVDEGAVQEDGYLFPAPNAGDTREDLGLQAFFQFNISPIPVNAIIIEVQVSFVNFDILGDPFTNLGCLRGYEADFFPLDSSDYMTTSGSSMKWCDSDQLNLTAVDDDVKLDLQNALGNTFLEYRLQFNDVISDYDGRDDMVRFGTVSLRITYQTEP